MNKKTKRKTINKKSRKRVKSNKMRGGNNGNNNFGNEMRTLFNTNSEKKSDDELKEIKEFHSKNEIVKTIKINEDIYIEENENILKYKHLKKEQIPDPEGQKPIILKVKNSIPKKCYLFYTDTNTYNHLYNGKIKINGIEYNIISSGGQYGIFYNIENFFLNGTKTNVTLEKNVEIFNINGELYFSEK